jgi:uncharacterized protein YbbC (DUF1343 family)
MRILLRQIALLVCATILTSSALAKVLPGIDVLAAQNFAPLQGKRVGLVTNQTGVSSSGIKTRLILKKHVNLVALFSPEHGIDGTVGAGKYVASRKDSVTGLPVWSLYGPTRKPTAEMLKGLDVLVYDMQDIGVRSYTYVSTMAKCMEACGEAGVEFMVLDRPNPLGGDRVEGPLIEERWRSFVGQLPVPYIHGMTVGELANMANSKGWTGKKCKLTVVPMQGWRRGMVWNDTGLSWVQTSPNIPRAASVVYYAATSIFGSLEGAALDVGIGTGNPFEMAGSAGLNAAAFCAQLAKCGIPVKPYARSEFGGARLALTAATEVNLAAINIHLLANLQRARSGSIFARYHDPDDIFWKIYGSMSIRSLIEKGTSAETIIAGWARGVQAFRSARMGFLLY